jgi:hypothetical protein
MALPPAAFCIEAELPSQLFTAIGVARSRSVIVIAVLGGAYRIAHAAER